MENDDFVSVKVFDKIVGFSFGLSKDDSSVLGVESLNKLNNCFVPLCLVHHHCIVIHSSRCPLFFFSDEVYLLHISQIISCNFRNPGRNSC